MRHTKIAVLLSGNGSNLEALAEASARGRLSATIALVLSDRPEAGGVERARRLDLPVWATPPSQAGSPTAHQGEWMKRIDEAGATLVCLAGYMRVLGPEFVGHYHGRLVNIHPSLLPAFPGAHGVRDALASGARVSGCTVHWVEEGVDSGPVIAQRAVPVWPDDTEATLHARIQREEHRLFPAIVEEICRGRMRTVGRLVERFDGPRKGNTGRETA